MYGNGNVILGHCKAVGAALFVVRDFKICTACGFADNGDQLVQRIRLNGEGNGSLGKNVALLGGKGYGCTIYRIVKRILGYVKDVCGGIGKRGNSFAAILFVQAVAAFGKFDCLCRALTEECNTLGAGNAGKIKRAGVPENILNRALKIATRNRNGTAICQNSRISNDCAACNGERCIHLRGY